MLFKLDFTTAYNRVPVNVESILKVKYICLKHKFEKGMRELNKHKKKIKIFLNVKPQAAHAEGITKRAAFISSVFTTSSVLAIRNTSLLCSLPLICSVALMSP